MEKRSRKSSAIEKIVVGGAVMLAVLLGGKILPSSGFDAAYLRGRDFENLKWITARNDSENVREYFKRENVPQNEENYYLYEKMTRDFNGNPRSLKGWIKVPDIDRNGWVSRYDVPDPGEAVSKED